MKSEIKSILESTTKKLFSIEIEAFEVSRTKLKTHGNWSSNIALVLGKELKEQPKVIAEKIIKRLPEKKWLKKVEVADPGFINFFLAEEAQASILNNALNENFFFCRTESPKKYLIEYVSSNPTGPIHVGHGRGAAFGSALANLLRHSGNEVEEEYYVNDRGLQTDILALSVFLRYQELFDQQIKFPEDCYQGEYIIHSAQSVKKTFGDKYVVKGDSSVLSSDVIPEILKQVKEEFPDFDELTVFILSLQIDDIKRVLSKFRVFHENWISEKKLYEKSKGKSMFDEVIHTLEKNNSTYVSDDALWFKSKERGDEKDRVLIRDNKDPTYFASDVAYHKFKFDRKFDRLVNIWGADHHGYIPRIKGALDALGLKGDLLETIIIQFVSLNRSGKTVSMSTRKGDFVSLNELIEEVGIDASRFFFLARKSDQALEFDVELALKKDKNNPVYYIQYAHARICSLLKEVEKRDFVIDSKNGLENLNLITGEQELSLINEIELFQDTLEQCQIDLEIHPLCFYLRDLASKFHSYYNANKFIEEEKNLRDAKFTIVLSIKRIITDGLNILAINAPEEM